MPRTTAGTYTLPAGNPVVSGTTISSTWANSTFTDIKAEITGSLSRSGYGGMLAPLELYDGSSAAPGLTFGSEADVGLYRNGTGDVRLAKAATDLMKWSTTEVRSYKNFVSEGTVTAATGLTVTAGGATVTAGGLTVSAGGSSMIGAVASSGTVAAPNAVQSSGNPSGTSGNTYAHWNARATSPNGGNQMYLTARTKNRAASTSWDTVDYGWTFDVDTTVAAGGSLYMGQTGASITSGTSATSADAAPAITLTNGNLKLSGTAPSSNVAVTNTLTPANIIKAWVLFTATGSSGGVTILDGLNVSGITISNITQEATITFAQAFASANYGVSGSVDEIAAAAYAISPATGRTASACAISVRAMNGGGARSIYSQQTSNIYVEFVGRQA